MAHDELPIHLELPSAGPADTGRAWYGCGHGGCVLLRREAQEFTHETRRVRVWHGPGGRCARALLGSVLYGGDAVHPVRRRGSLHASVGGNFPPPSGNHRVEDVRLLEMLVYLGFVAV